MPNSNHYTISMINVEDNLLLKNVVYDKFYYYDDLNWYIIEKSISDLNDFVLDHINYIFIYSKLKNI